MGKGGGVFRKILVWSFERGTIQYDIICGLLLAFIFFVPRSCFIKPSTDAPKNGMHASAASPVNSSQFQATAQR